MVGVKKNGRRLVALPPALAQSAEGKSSSNIPPHTTVIIDFTILRVRNLDTFKYVFNDSEALEMITCFFWITSW